jgi:hypothetical protein
LHGGPSVRWFAGFFGLLGRGQHDH